MCQLRRLFISFLTTIIVLSIISSSHPYNKNFFFVTSFTAPCSKSVASTISDDRKFLFNNRINDYGSSMSGRQKKFGSSYSLVDDGMQQRSCCSLQQTSSSTDENDDEKRAVSFSVIMSLCGAALGPFLDSYHSAFGVLEYKYPITLQLWGVDEAHPALTTAWWVPELFGLAGFIIGWLYILLDSLLLSDNKDKNPTNSMSPSLPLVFLGISFFTFQYYASGVLFSLSDLGDYAGELTWLDRSSILNIMSVLAALGFATLDNTLSGFIVSTATAVGGPLIEAGLIEFTKYYHYTDDVGSETGIFPLWIVPVYFLGGPAVGNLARYVWNQLSVSTITKQTEQKKVRDFVCPQCNNSRAVPCPNCDNSSGYYVTYGKTVKCNCCKGRGLVICRACFDQYDDDPADIESIREMMSRMPD